MAHASEFNITSANGFARIVEKSGFADLISNLRARIEQRRVFTTTLKELESLTARDLSDLGLNKHALRAIAREAAYGQA